MKTKGKIISWNDGKGYGFIAPMVEGERIFVHINAFGNRSRRPKFGDVVTYSTSVDAKGRPCAADVVVAGVQRSTKVAPSSWVYSVLVPVCFLLLVGGSVLVSAIPMPVLLIYLVISLATFVAYAFDKSAAKRGGWRTSENTLHLLSLVGGWPGALVAQSRLRHKSRKQSFRVVFWVTVILNCAAFVWLFTPEAAKAWQSIVSVVV